jgi:hypothetical protein
MNDFKTIPCKSIPIREFIVEKNRPNQIGVRLVGMKGGRFWYRLKKVNAEIEKLEEQLKFWRELKRLFSEKNLY